MTTLKFVNVNAPRRSACQLAAVEGEVVRVFKDFRVFRVFDGCHLFVGEDRMYGDAVEVGCPQVVEGLYGDGVGGAFLQLNGYHFPSHAVGIPRAGAVAIVLEGDGVANLFAVDEEFCRARVSRHII